MIIISKEAAKRGIPVLGSMKLLMDRVEKSLYMALTVFSTGFGKPKETRLIKVGSTEGS